MLGWALTFFVIAAVAAVLGYGDVAGDAAGIAQVVFAIFAGLCGLSLLAERLRRYQK